MKITNLTKDENLKQAIAIVIKHYKDDEFLKQVRAIDFFNHTTDSGFEVARKIQTFDGTITLKMYRPWNPWTKANAYRSGNVIYFNDRKSFNVIDYAVTIYHEFCHVLGYGHKTNYVTKYNLGTVNYRISIMFAEYIKAYCVEYVA